MVIRWNRFKTWFWCSGLHLYKNDIQHWWVEVGIDFFLFKKICRSLLLLIFHGKHCRLFSCGSSKGQESFLVEWNDNDGTLKQRYFGLGKQYAGVVHFDTSKKLLAAGDEFCVKFWDMNNQNLLFSTIADGGLPVTTWWIFCYIYSFLIQNLTFTKII